jgi:hypothetical protein
VRVGSVPPLAIVLRRAICETSDTRARSMVLLEDVSTHENLHLAAARGRSADASAISEEAELRRLPAILHVCTRISARPLGRKRWFRMNTYKHTLLVFPAVLVLTLTIGAGPASAMADEQATCVGEFASSLNQFGQTFGVQGLGGRLIAEAALREGGVARYASIDNCD